MESVPNSNFLKVVAQGQKCARGNHLPMIRVRKSAAYFTQIDIRILNYLKPINLIEGDVRRVRDERGPI